ncbi:MAG: hemolysin family protein [Actinobacteria bacterium]|nr:hemolysin family protein [Actinomycetota bacterium]
MSDFLRILAIVLLVLGNAIFVAAEYALVTARRGRLESQHNRRARVALALLDNPVAFISTVQVGITAFSIALGAVGQPLLAGFFEPWVAAGISFAIAFFILTFLSLVIGELVPKAVALQKAESIAMLLAIPLAAFQRLLKPAVWVLQGSANWIARAFGVTPAPAGIAIHTEEDIRNTIAEGGESGVIEEAEQEMLYKVFDFAEKEAHDVMVPRPQVVALSVDLPTREALAAMIDSPYTRYPVYSGSLDEVRGILHVRELFKALYDRGIDNVRLPDLVRPAYLVPETKDLGALLAEFRRTNQHMAIVVDEYGGMEGIVTLEDLLEEIVGEIEDEYDLPDESIERLDDGRVRVDGTFPIDDFNEQFAQDVPVEDYHTVAGFVFGQLGRAAQAGDQVLHDGVRFEVVEVDGPRIERLEIEFLRRDEAEPAAVPEP